MSIRQPYPTIPPEYLKETEADALYLKLNQTTPQTVSNGAPIFNAGLTSNDHVTIKAGKRLYLDGA